MTLPKSKKRKQSITIGLLVLLILFSLLLVVVRITSGKGLGLRSLPRNIWHTTLAIINKNDVSQLSTGNFENIIFLHHSTGDNLIGQSNLRELLTSAGFNFWDHSYNYLGLRDPRGMYTGYSYSVPRDNTDPDGLDTILQQSAYEIPLNTLSALLQYDVIIFKSCFTPTSKITSDEQLKQYKNYYLSIRDKVDKHPNKLFILLTQPPLNPAETNPEEAQRARLLSEWLVSEEYLGARQNYSVFNFFNYLAENNPSRDDYNMLAEMYRNGSDSHPNKIANQEVGPILADYVKNAIVKYRGY